MAAFDNPTNTTQLAGIMQTVVASRMVPQYEKRKVFRKLLGPEGIILVPNNAETWRIGQRDVMTFDAMTQGTEDTPEAFDVVATDKRDFVPIVFAASALVPWEAANDTPVAVLEEIAEASAVAAAFLEDSNTTYGFAATYVEATAAHEIGANGTALDAALILNGYQLLMTAGAPEPYNLVVDPIQVKELLTDTNSLSWLRQRGTEFDRTGDFAATVGVNPDRYVGRINGVDVWRADAMIESTGLFAIMFGRYALGYSYKLISNPLNPTPQEMSATVQWEDSANSYRVTFRVCMDIGGMSDTATTNRFMVALVS